MGLAARKANDWDLALSNFDKALEVDASFCEPYYWRGLTWLELDQPYVAKQVLHTHLLHLPPEHLLPDNEGIQICSGCSGIWSSHHFDFPTLSIHTLHCLNPVACSVNDQLVDERKGGTSWWSLSLLLHGLLQWNNKMFSLALSFWSAFLLSVDVIFAGLCCGIGL